MAYHTRDDGPSYQIVRAENRSDDCYRGKRGIYWHNLTDEFAIDPKTVTGPFDTVAEAYIDAMQTYDLLRGCRGIVNASIITFVTFVSIWVMYKLGWFAFIGWVE